MTRAAQRRLREARQQRQAATERSLELVRQVTRAYGAHAAKLGAVIAFKMHAPTVVELVAVDPAARRLLCLGCGIGLRTAVVDQTLLGGEHLGADPTAPLLVLRGCRRCGPTPEPSDSHAACSVVRQAGPGAAR